MSDRNFGDEQPVPKDPGFRVAEGNFSIVMPERLILALLRDAAARLSDPKNESELRRFFSHFFDTMIEEKERESYIRNFQDKPPKVSLGYPRTNATFPCITVVLEADEEDQEALGDYLGETQDGDPHDEANEYVGGMYRKTYGVFIFAEHPDTTLYLYHFAKAVMVGARDVLQSYGITKYKTSGAELSPQENYLPENMFARRLGITVLSIETSPIILTPDPARVRVAGISAKGTIVSGVRGGVSTTGSDDDDE